MHPLLIKMDQVNKHPAPSVHFDEEMDMERPQDLECFCIAPSSLLPAHRSKFVSQLAPKLRPSIEQKMLKHGIGDRTLVPTGKIPSREPGSGSNGGTMLPCRTLGEKRSSGR